ncbi:MAG: hypothetical protein JWR44_3106 [Hymenobacter sp.]|nr:hypothetical protein [Hymenobacter sp.]
MRPATAPHIEPAAAAKLWRMKALHTVVWAFFVAAILAVLYSGIANSITVYTWIASVLVAAEGLVLMAFKSHCPLTLIARKYSSSTKDNFDIFLPEWLARHNKLIFSVLYALGLVLVGYRLVP